jgi:hypothetical protein
MKQPFFNRSMLAGFTVGASAALAAAPIGMMFCSFPLFIICVVALYNFLACCWLTYISPRHRTTHGALLGLATSAVYLAMTLNQQNLQLAHFADIIRQMFVLPPVLAGLMVGIIGSNRSNWLKAFPAGLLKGSISGFVFCVLHLITVAAFSLTFSSTIALIPYPGANSVYYLLLLPLALGLTSALFFPVIRLSIGAKTEPESESSLSRAVTRWAGKLTLSKAGLMLFVLMSLAGVAWAFLLR